MVDTYNMSDEEMLKKFPEQLALAEKFGSPKCMKCKKPVVYAPHAHAICEGHVYSELGYREMRISRMCEYCFDNMPELDDGYEDVSFLNYEEEHNIPTVSNPDAPTIHPVQEV